MFKNLIAKKPCLPHGKQGKNLYVNSPLRFNGLGTVTTCHSSGRIRVYQAADLSTLLLRPACFHPTSCTSAMMELMPYTLGSCLWCDFVAVSSGLPPPFPSFRLFPLVASAVSGLHTLFVWFYFFCFCYPRPFASAFSHFNRRHSPTLRPVFIQLAHTVFCGR